MLYDNASFDEINKALMNGMRADLHRSKSFRGQRERAMFKGWERMFFKTKIKGEDFLYDCLLKEKVWRPILLLRSQEGESAAWYGRNFYVVILKGHAVVRYIQRKVYHDEKREISTEEFVSAIFRMFMHLNTTKQSYDKIGEQLLMYYDDGAFLCREKDRIVTLSTYIPISKMYPNQSMSLQKAKAGTDEERNRAWCANMEMVKYMDSIACTKRLKS